jgi:hypothetical protein
MNRDLEPGEIEVCWQMNGTQGPCPSWAEDPFQKQQAANVVALPPRLNS